MGETEPKLEPQLDYKVVFCASKFQRSLAQWLATLLTRCRTLQSELILILQNKTIQGNRITEKKRPTCNRPNDSRKTQTNQQQQQKKTFWPKATGVLVGVNDFGQDPKTCHSHSTPLKAKG